MQHPNQLQFNLDVVTDAQNLRTDFTSPSAIMFERILPKERKTARSTASDSPVKHSAISNQRLSAALKLAKRDLKLAKRRKVLRDFANENSLSLEESLAKPRPCAKHPSGTALCLIPAERLRSPERKPVAQKKSRNIPRSPVKVPKHEQEILDVKRLRLELQQIILTLENNIEDKQVLHRQKLLTLDQEQEQKLVVRHLEQMRKSSRTVYNLQQQTQVVKDELKRFQRTGSDKCRPVGKLAAVHRGTVRLLQVYATQLPEHLIFRDNFVAVKALYQEISRLVKELSLCALQMDLANVEEVERLTEALKNIEPRGPPPRPVMSPKERRPKSPHKGPVTPQRSFRSKGISMVKKSYVQPRIGKASVPSRTHPKQEPQFEASSPKKVPTDIFDRPEWRPPSNSPHKNVGPPPLTPLLESLTPMPRAHTKPKQVKFFSTPKQMEIEHDIEAFEPHTPRDLKILKTRLADELEAELKNRINPLLKKVEDLAKSSEVSGHVTSQRKTPEEEILENQVREIIDETRREMQNFQREEEVEVQAVSMQQRPSLESLLLRLDAIDKEEEAIRRKWKQINYDDTRPDSPTISQAHVTAPKTPQPFKFTKSASHSPEEPLQKIVNFIPQERNSDTPQAMVVKRPSKTKGKSKEFAGRILDLPPSTLNAIKRNKREFERHLKFTFHEPKGNFDPWKLVEELSDQVLDEIITSVSGEVDGLCEDYAKDIFQREFANASMGSEPSWTASETSSALETPPRK